jgi:hypothetical protein
VLPDRGKPDRQDLPGTYIDAIHALGDYPEDWEGHRFDHAPLIWCLGYSGEKTRDLLQEPIVGRKNGDGSSGGLIPAERIGLRVDDRHAERAAHAVCPPPQRRRIDDIQFWSTRRASTR